MNEKIMRENLFQEFLAVHKYPIYPLEHFNAVVVLCAEEVEVDGENGMRIHAGLEICKNTGAVMIFLGTIYHNTNLKAFLIQHEAVVSVYFPRNRKSESSWTQVRALAVFLKRKSFPHLLILSSAYHIPRIRRYCQQYLPTTQERDFYPVGNILEQKHNISSEIDRIIRYAEKGNLPLWVKP